MHYYKIVSRDDNELLAIWQTDKIYPIESGHWLINAKTSTAIGSYVWWRISISKPEFETFQVFGIREIEC